MTPVTRPFASVVRTGTCVAEPYVPAVPVFARVSAAVTGAEPSKFTFQLASPVIAMLRGVVSFGAGAWLTSLIAATRFDLSVVNRLLRLPMLVVLPADAVLTTATSAVVASVSVAVLLR